MKTAFVQSAFYAGYFIVAIPASLFIKKTSYKIGIMTGLAFFALGCGILTFVIREYCAYPEGVSLSILVMNILAPMIEKWTAATPLGLGGPKNAK